jgi:hypothetical protein
VSYQVPYDPRGNLLSSPYEYQGKRNPNMHVTWEENEEFETSLTINSFWDGSSTWTSDEDRSYNMHNSDFGELIKKITITAGKTEKYKWLIRKRGAVYGIALAPGQ